MTEAEWLTGGKPWTMLDLLPEWPSGRKVRLFGGACCCRWVPHLPDTNGDSLIVLSERFADALVDATTLDAFAATTVSGYKLVT